jgi:hypothetical protein
MKVLFDIAYSFISNYLTNFIKFESLKLYSVITDKSRRIFIYLALAFVTLLIILSGFVFVHISIFLLLPWDVQTKAIIFLILGLLYFLVPLILLSKVCCKKTWDRITGLEEFAERCTKKQE